MLVLELLSSQSGCQTFIVTLLTGSDMSVINSGPGRSSYSYCGIGPKECALRFHFQSSHRRLDSNPLICSCDVLWLSRLLKRTPHTVTAATCSQPSVLRGRTLARLSLEDVNCCKYCTRDNGSNLLEKADSLAARNLKQP